ncbi:MAG: amino acid--tRNA ligase-related protein, partial [Limisphaerales bacterium]
EIIREIRNFLHSRGFVEVETPMMQAIPGGAAAQPFKTHHNALGCDFYLRIALELYLKRLLVGGVDKVFEIGRNFRNEGLSRKHNPEFTMLEAYQAFGDYESMMELVESMVKHIAQKVFGTLKIPINRKTEVEIILSQLNNSFPKEIIDASQIGIPFAETDSLTRKAFEPIYDLLDECVDVLPDKEHWNTARMITSLLEQAESAMRTLAQEHSRKFDTAKFFQFIADYRAKVKPLETIEIIDLTPKWRRAKYKDLIREKAGADWFEVSPEARRQRAHDLGAEITKDYADFEVTGAVFEKLIEPTLIQPTFVTHLPKELVPLAKISPDDSSCVEVFECCINGQEISPGYTEQNDPIEQRERLEHQAGGEQQKLDEDFLIALEHGMPPAGGIGIGIDRLCMMLLGQESIRDVILFPQLKPK